MFIEGQREIRRPGGRQARRDAVAARTGARHVDYHNLRNPFPPASVFSEERLDAIHEAALEVLEDLGMKVLLPEARELFRASGARVDDETQMVYIGRDLATGSIATAPKSFTLRAGSHAKDVLLELGVLTIQTGPDIVWIPGGDSRAESWGDMFPFFTADFRCISYDPRGIEGTVAPPVPFSLEDMAADCAAMIEATCKGPVVLTGLSMGGSSPRPWRSGTRDSMQAEIVAGKLRQIITAFSQYARCSVTQGRAAMDAGRNGRCKSDRPKPPATQG